MKRWSRIVSLLLAVALLAGGVTPACAGATNHEQQYQMALGLMYNLRNRDNLNTANKLFSELGAYELSSYYSFYIQIVLQLQTEDAGEITKAVQMLPYLASNAAFAEDLTARALPACELLTAYGEGRLLEAEGRYTEAQAAYQTAPTLDALERTMRLIPLAQEEQARKAAEEAARQEAERKAAEEAARAEAARKAAEEAARAEAERKAAEEAAQTIALEPIAVGNTITFGRYEQDNDLSNGPEPIEWLVLDVQDNRALLLSRYGLDAKPYNEKQTDVTWENCSLRRWLKDEFINAAFTAREQTGILTTAVDNSTNQGYYDADGGNNTQDKIFLLSYAEANKYFGVTVGDSNNTKSRVALTAYASKRGAWDKSTYKTADNKAAGWWWLRSPGLDQSSAASVDVDGSLVVSPVDTDGDCVRPALWINLESGIF